MMAVVDILTRTEAWLRKRGIDSPRLEAELLIAHVLGMERLQIYLNHDRPMTAEEQERLRPLVARRGKREPLAWILGSTGFHALDLVVHPNVLVPRPDTETLVDAALEWIPADEDPCYVADIGCGTGAVGLAVAAARPGVRLYAIDLSEEAVENTKVNVAKLGLDRRVGVLRGPYLDPVPRNRPIEWVLSNPPYVPRGEIPALMPEVSRWEPRLALDGGPDGLEVYRELVPRAVERASRGVLLEVGAGQAPRVVHLLERAGLVGVRTWTDLGGHARVVGGLVPRADKLLHTALHQESS